MTVQNIVLLSASIPTGLIALVGWLFRTYITESLKRDLEQTKSKLDHDLERHKKELNISRFRYERIHEKRLEALIEFYEKLAITDVSLDVLTAEFKKGSSPDELDKKELEDYQKSHESFNNMWLFYYKNKVLFNEDLCVQIDAISKMYRNMFENFKYRLGAKYQNYIGDDQLKVLKKRFDETRKIKKELPKVLERIDKSFKEEIGLINQPTEVTNLKDS